MAVDSSGGNAIASSPAKTGIKVVGSRIDDSANGKTCHQCRHKTMDFAAACKNQRNNRPCSIKLCQKCLLNRYGEKAGEVATLGDWSCPKCRGICNCSVCMKKRGYQPTGILKASAKATGFSVSEMLLKRAEGLNHEKVGADTVASLKKAVGFSPRKIGKENSLDGKVESNLPKSVNKNSKKVKGVLSSNIDDYTSSKIINQGLAKRQTKREGLNGISDDNRNPDVLSKEAGSHGGEKKPKKMKRDRLGEMGNGKNGARLKEINVNGDEKKPKKSRRDRLEETGISNIKDLTLARRSNPRKLKVSNRGAEHNSGVDLGQNANCRITVPKNNSVGTFENDKRKREDGSNNENAKDFLKHQAADFYADIPLPVGTQLTSVAGIDVPAEDVGNALQFLEFCSVFGKILEVRKGQSECALRDIFHGRSARRGKFSLTVQFLIHLLSIIQTEQGKERATPSPSYGKKSWFHMLKTRLFESQSFLKAQGMDLLQNASDYETLEASEKLRILNLLCDEVLGTEKVRNWIEVQNKELAEKAKEARQKLLAAKDKKKNLKQKMKDDIAKAIIDRGGAHLTISEKEAIVSNLKPEAAQAHAQVLESNSMLMKSSQTSDALRIEPIFMEHDGHAYWKLNCCSISDVLHQNVGQGDTLTLDEKWSALDVEEKEAVEKHISALRGKRLRALKVSCQ